MSLVRNLVLLLAVTGATPARASDLHTLCTWSSARWEQRATLLLPGTDLPFAEAWQHDEVRLSGTLGLDPWLRPRFRVDLAGDGLAVSGDVDPSGDAVFSLLTAVPLGRTGAMLPGSLISIRGEAPDGQVLVGPHRWVDHVTLGEHGVVPCEAITVHWRPHPEEPALLAAVGFPADGPVMVLPKGRGATVRDAPGGAWVATVRARAWSLPLRVAEERDGWAHVAEAHWTGTAWQGWVRVRRLVAPALDASDGVSGVLGALTGAASVEFPVRRCERDAPLRAAVSGRVADVGTVRAGTPFVVAGERDGAWSVTFPAGWFDPAEGAALLVPADPAHCAEGTWTRPGFQGLEGLLAPGVE